MKLRKFLVKFTKPAELVGLMGKEQTSMNMQMGSVKMASTGLD